MIDVNSRLEQLQRELRSSASGPHMLSYCISGMFLHQLVSTESTSISTLLASFWMFTFLSLLVCVGLCSLKHSQATLSVSIFTSVWLFVIDLRDFVIYGNISNIILLASAFHIFYGFYILELTFRQQLERKRIAGTKNVRN